MNERIRELLRRAEERHPKHLAVAVPEVVLRQDALDMFAELVVKETIDEMITQMWNYGIDESNNPQFYKIIDRTIQEMLDVAPAKD
jgi:hypothetical protein